MPDYSATQGDLTPPPKRQLTWGAIAIDSETGGAGTVTGRANKSDAIRDAM
jgi:hypothetical protein